MHKYCLRKKKDLKKHFNSPHVLSAVNTQSCLARQKNQHQSPPVAYRRSPKISPWQSHSADCRSEDRGSGTTDECFGCSGTHSSEIGVLYMCVNLTCALTKKQANSAVNTIL
jgi:hypothetical protein